MWFIVSEGQNFVPRVPYGGHSGDKNTKKIWKQAEKTERKRKYKFSESYWFYALYRFIFSLFMLLFSLGYFPMQNFIKIFPNTSSAVISPPTISARWNPGWWNHRKDEFGVRFVRGGYLREPVIMPRSVSHSWRWGRKKLVRGRRQSLQGDFVVLGYLFFLWQK